MHVFLIDPNLLQHLFHLAQTVHHAGFNAIGLILRTGLYDDPGPFTKVLEMLKPLARDAWNFGIGLFIILGSLGGLYYGITGLSGSLTGGSGLTSRAIIGVVAIVVVVIMIFLLLPQLVDILTKSAPQPPF